MIKKTISLLFAVCCLGVTTFSQTPTPSPAPAAKPKPQKVHFTMVALMPRSLTTTAWADVRVNHYSSDATIQRLAGVLVEGGQDALVKELEKLKPIGKASLSSRTRNSTYATSPGPACCLLHPSSFRLHPSSTP